MNGYTTDDLIREELPLVQRVRPTLVTLLVGANDLVAALRDERLVERHEARYRAQLARIHERVRSDAPGASVCALPQPDWSRSPSAGGFGDPSTIGRAIERYNEIARETAGALGSSYLDLFPLMREQAARGMVAPDGLHPSAAAYAEWADALVRSLGPPPRRRDRS